MRQLFPLQRLEARVRTVAVVIGAIIAVAIPAGYFILAFSDALSERSYEARLSAGALSRYAYIQGLAWRFNRLRLEELIDFVEAPEAVIRQLVYDDTGGLLLTIGEHA